MRGASVVRRRSVPNLGETSGSAGPVQPGQTDGGGSGLLAGGTAGDGPAIPGAARRDTDPVRATGPQIALGQASAAQGILKRRLDLHVDRTRGRMFGERAG